jgi:predicted nucleotidyltransferase
MVEKKDLIIKKLHLFYEIINKIYPIKKIFLYGSCARGQNNRHSDIDVGVVVDVLDHRKRIAITADLYHYASRIDASIEPKCIFWDEYQNHDRASILAEIIRTGVPIL